MASKFRIKKGVSLVGLQLETREIIKAVYYAYDMLNMYCMITSTLDGIHSPDSLHPFGYAIDFRTFHLTKEYKQQVFVQVKRSLLGISPFYDVVLSKNCLHVEYDIIRYRKQNGVMSRG